MQMTALLISLLGMAAVALVFVSAAQAASGGGADAPSTGAEQQRYGFILGLLLLGVPISAASLWPWPHVAQTGMAARSTINVTGGQWYWQIDHDKVPQGVPVTFNVSSADVTHGFGVVDSTGRILFQVQAMPGYVNRVAWTFDTPGTYRVICLEYCGVAHHAMLSQFSVEERT